MLKKVVARATAKVAKSLQRDHMRRIGISTGMRLARAYYRLRYRRQEAYRRRLYGSRFDALIAENGPLGAPSQAMEDGFLIDASTSHPHLPRLLETTDAIIAERGRVRRSDAGAYRSFFQNIVTPDDVRQHPTILDFALSSDVLSVVCRYLQTIPSLSRVHPPGIRLAESFAEFDDRPETPHDSQLFHMDYYSQRCVYVLVLLHDTTIDHGPFTFLPASTSARVADRLNYWSRGVPYRLSDEQVFAHASEDEVIRMTHRRGTILYIDPSKCLHFGSRDAVQPRYLLMIGYSTAIRTDFGEFYLAPFLYAGGTRQTPLGRLVLERNYEL